MPLGPSAIRALVLGGVAGPMLFASIVVVAASLRPEYSHLSQFMSELGETGSRSQALMNYGGFVPTALLVLMASASLRVRFGSTWAGLLGSAWVAVFGLGMLGVGLFPCDAGCLPDAPSRSQQIHYVFGTIGDLALVLAPLCFAFHFRQLDGWKPLFAVSIATTVLSLSALLAVGASLPERTATGLFQRVQLGVQFTWLGIVCWRVRRRVGSLRSGMEVEG